MLLFFEVRLRFVRNKRSKPFVCMWLFGPNELLFENLSVQLWENRREEKKLHCEPVIEDIELLLTPPCAQVVNIFLFSIDENVSLFYLFAWSVVVCSHVCVCVFQRRN